MARPHILLDFSVVAPGGSLTYATGFLRPLPGIWRSEYAPQSELSVVLPGDRNLLADEEELLRVTGIDVYRVSAHSPGSWRGRIASQLSVPLLASRLRATDLFVTRDIPPVLASRHLTILARNVLVWEKPTYIHDRILFRAMRLAGRISIRRATGVIAVSATIACKLPPRAGQFRQIVFHGCDLPPLRTMDKIGTWLSGGTRLRFIGLGVITPHKRLDILIETVAMLRQRGVDSELEIWGSTHDEEELFRLRQLALARLGEDVLRGPVSLADRSTVLQRADILLMGSSIESFGLPMVEAMRSSTVVVAPRSQLVDEICGPCAITYEEGSCRSAGDAILRALPRLSVLAAAGCQRSETVFTWPLCVRSTLNALLEGARPTANSP